MLLERARQSVVLAAREVARLGLVAGTAGNISLRDEDTGYVAITPSAVPYDAMRPEEIAVVDQDGRLIEARFRPSSESPMHLCMYRHRPWVHGIVHTHSVYATTFACLNQEIPAAHYLIALAGPRIPVAGYAPYGTPELGEKVVQAMRDSKAVLLQNHGVVTAGRTLPEALMIAVTVEYVAGVYYRARAIGRPVIVPDEEIERLRVRFEAYRPEEIS